MTVQWKSGTNWRVAADTAHQEIEKIRKKNHGNVTAGDVVAAAKSARSPLHPEFEWNDEAAANEHRLYTARTMLRSFVVVRDDIKTDRPQRVYEVVRDVVKSEPGTRTKHVYKTVDDIMKDSDYRAELLGRALRELISIRSRYRDLQELAVVLRAIDEVVESMA
jgi:hypothetical protein